MSAAAKNRLGRLERLREGEPLPSIRSFAFRRKVEVPGQAREPDPLPPPREDRTNPRIGPPPEAKAERVLPKIIVTESKPETPPFVPLVPHITAARKRSGKPRATVRGALLKIFGGFGLFIIGMGGMLPAFTDVLPSIPFPIMMAMIAFQIGSYADKKWGGKSNE